MYHLTGWLTEHLQTQTGSSTASSLANVNLLGAVTKPLTKKVIQVITKHRNLKYFGGFLIIDKTNNKLIR